MNSQKYNKQKALLVKANAEGGFVCCWQTLSSLSFGIFQDLEIRLMYRLCRYLKYS